MPFPKVNFAAFMFKSSQLDHFESFPEHRAPKAGSWAHCPSTPCSGPCCLFSFYIKACYIRQHNLFTGVYVVALRRLVML